MAGQRWTAAVTAAAAAAAVAVVADGCRGYPYMEEWGG